MTTFRSDFSRALAKLEALTAKDHAQRHRVTHCRHGHAFTPENTRITPEGGRKCRTCHRNRERKRYWDAKAIT